MIALGFEQSVCIRAGFYAAEDVEGDVSGVFSHGSNLTFVGAHVKIRSKRF
jgi:hypothetical protein